MMSHSDESNQIFVSARSHMGHDDLFTKDGSIDADPAPPFIGTSSATGSSVGNKFLARWEVPIKQAREKDRSDG